jgi:choline-sulfatase
MPTPALVTMRGFIWALAAAATGAAPAALRIAGTASSLPVVWLAIAGLLAVPSIVAVVASALTLDAWRKLPTARKRSLVAWGTFCFVLWLPLLVVGGAALKVSTHHRGLGGAAYGVFAGAALLLAVLVAYRAVDWSSRAIGARWTARVGVVLFSLGVLAMVVLGARLFVRSGATALTPRAQVGIVDALVWLFAVVIGALARTPTKVGRTLGAVTVGAAVALLGAAVALPLVSPELVTRVRDGAPMAAPISQVVEMP